MRLHATLLRRPAALAGAVALLSVLVDGVRAQDGHPPGPAPADGGARGAAYGLPFAPGERLTYAVRVARVGGVGRSAMWIEGPTDVRGSDTWLLRFDFEARVALLKAEDRTSSWLDARRVASLRFRKHEHHPLSRRDEQVELFPESRRWEATDGSSGESPSDAPLDELSFMYFLRTLPLDEARTWRFDRHYDAERNPTSVRLVGRDTVETELGRFVAVELEMHVRDPRRYKGEGVIRIHLSDDACRIPLRIESRMPLVGSAVMTLEGHNLGECESKIDNR